MGKYTNLDRREEIALYAIRSEAGALWQEVEALPVYRQRNIAKILRSIFNNTALVLNSHGDEVFSLPENVDPMEQLRRA